jgi:hypothetical protein
MIRRIFGGMMFVFLSLLWNACTKDYVYHEPLLPPSSQDSIVKKLSFAERIIPIFQDHCVECHTPGFVLDLTAANAYNDLWAKSEIDTLTPTNSNLYLRMSSITNPMPPDGNLPTDTIQVVLQWIQEGAKNN